MELQILFLIWLFFTLTGSVVYVMAKDITHRSTTDSTQKILVNALHGTFVAIYMIVVVNYFFAFYM